MDKCIARHMACLRAEWPRTVFMNNPKFQMVSNITRTKLEVIDLDFSLNPFNFELYYQDNTDEWSELLDLGINVLVMSGEFDLFSAWHGNFEAVTNFNWKHNQLFRNKQVEKVGALYVKSAENLTFIKFDGAGYIPSETHPKEVIYAIYKHLIGIDFDKRELKQKDEIYSESG